MAGSASKNKGKSWEREFARFLTDLYQASFIRTPSSGAYIGGKNSVRKEFLHEGQIRAMKGDIIPPGDWTRFNVECKNYNDFPFHQLTQGKVNKLEDWIDQCVTASDPEDLNLIIIKVSRKGTYVASPQHPSIKPGTHYFSYKSPSHGNWYITDFDTFWQLNKDTVKTLSLAF